LKLNLGCGKDLKEGYTNVDLREPCDLQQDLSKLPWGWESGSADEILMLDFLEHFPYAKTDQILLECWRVLKPRGSLIIQVPDFEHCALAALDMQRYLCNVCGNSGKDYVIKNNNKHCSNCDTPLHKVAQAALNRLYGGQDYEGNWHYTAFTKELLERKLSEIGFCDFEYLEKHHQWKNWNFKIKAIKKDSVW